MMSSSIAAAAVASASLSDREWEVDTLIHWHAFCFWSQRLFGGGGSSPPDPATTNTQQLHLIVDDNLCAFLVLPPIAGECGGGLLTASRAHRGQIQWYPFPTAPPPSRQDYSNRTPQTAVALLLPPTEAEADPNIDNEETAVWALQVLQHQPSPSSGGGSDFLWLSRSTTRLDLWRNLKPYQTLSCVVDGVEAWSTTTTTTICELYDGSLVMSHSKCGLSLYRRQTSPPESSDLLLLHHLPNHFLDQPSSTPHRVLRVPEPEALLFWVLGQHPHTEELQARLWHGEQPLLDLSWEGPCAYHYQALAWPQPLYVDTNLSLVDTGERSVTTLVLAGTSGSHPGRFRACRVTGPIVTTATLQEAEQDCAYEVTCLVTRKLPVDDYDDDDNDQQQQQQRWELVVGCVGGQVGLVPGVDLDETTTTTTRATPSSLFWDSGGDGGVAALTLLYPLPNGELMTGDANGNVTLWTQLDTFDADDDSERQTPLCRWRQQCGGEILALAPSPSHHHNRQWWCLVKGVGLLLLRPVDLPPPPPITDEPPKP